MKNLLAIDLFSGAGGMSHGFMQTGKIVTAFAVENNKDAKKTYISNNPGTEMLDDITKITFKKIKDKLKLEGLRIDLVIGGPPCQGFSNANRQRNELISVNNQLVKEYIRAIKELEPNAFVLENVKSMTSDKHRFFYSRNDEKLVTELNIATSKEEYSLAKAVQDSNQLINFIRHTHDFSEYCLQRDVYLKFVTLLRHSKNPEKMNMYISRHKTTFLKIINSWEKLHQSFWSRSYRKRWYETKAQLYEFYWGNYNCFDKLVANIMIIIENQKVFFKMQEVVDHNICIKSLKIRDGNIMIELQTYSVIDYIKASFKSMNYIIDDGILNAAHFGVPQERERLFIIGVRKDLLSPGKKVSLPVGFVGDKSNYTNIAHALKDLEILRPETDIRSAPFELEIKNHPHPITRYLNDSNLIYNHVMTNTRKTALERFSKIKPGGNFHSLNAADKTTYSDPSRTQNTIYQRLDYNMTSGTVLNVRKSMWIHPVIDRALSIREAARLQTFPDSFVFKGTKDSQYQQVGNAVPPLLARAVAEKVLEILGIEVDEKLVDIFRRDHTKPVVLNT